MKLLLGITRTRVSYVGETILTQQVQNGKDIFEIELPDDDSEYISMIWMNADGKDLLRLPLEIVGRLYPRLTWLVKA